MYYDINLPKIAAMKSMRWSWQGAYCPGAPLNDFTFFADNRCMMTSKELMPLLIQVISSWQVIIVTIAVILYFSLVFFVGRTSGRSHYASSISSQPKIKRKKTTSKESTGPQVSVNDELGLEE